MKNIEIECLERQKELAPIHEAGHAVAARYVQLEIVSVDIYEESGGKCGNTRVIPMSAEYSLTSNLPLDPCEALLGFKRHNFQVLAGAAAQAHYLYTKNLRNLSGFMSFQPENWGIIIEFSKDDKFFEFSEEKLTSGTAFFLNETGATGDWVTLLGHFNKLPYHYFDDFNTHEKRSDYLRTLWLATLEKVREKWDDVNIVAEALKTQKCLSGDEVESLLE